MWRRHHGRDAVFSGRSRPASLTTRRRGAGAYTTADDHGGAWAAPGRLASCNSRRAAPHWASTSPSLPVEQGTCAAASRVAPQCGDPRAGCGATNAEPQLDWVLEQHEQWPSEKATARPCAAALGSTGATRGSGARMSRVHGGMMSGGRCSGMLTGLGVAAADGDPRPGTSCATWVECRLGLVLCVLVSWSYAVRTPHERNR